MRRCDAYIMHASDTGWACGLPDFFRFNQESYLANAGAPCNAAQRPVCARQSTVCTLCPAARLPPDRVQHTCCEVAGCPQMTAWGWWDLSRRSHRRQSRRKGAHALGRLTAAMTRRRRTALRMPAPQRALARCALLQVSAGHVHPRAACTQPDHHTMLWHEAYLPYSSC